MSTRAMIVSLFAVLAMTFAAEGDAIQKWRTPEGGLYFGDRPPAGSTLVETIADTPRSESGAVGGGMSDLEKEAAQGREIIRQREVDRAAARQLEAEEREREDAIAARELDFDWEPDVVVIDPVPWRHPPHHHHPHDGGGRYHPGHGGPPRVGGYHPPPPLAPPRSQGGGRILGPSPKRAVDAR